MAKATDQFSRFLAWFCTRATIDRSSRRCERYWVAQPACLSEPWKTSRLWIPHVIHGSEQQAMVYASHGQHYTLFIADIMKGISCWSAIHLSRHPEINPH